MSGSSMHPSSAELIDFAEGQKKSPAHASVRDHLGGACRHCRLRLDLYRLLIGSLREGPLVDAPYSLVEAAIGLFSRRRATSPDPPPPLRHAVELLARLVFDSERDGMRMAPAVRAVGMERRLRFEGGDLELDVLLRPDPRGVRLIAQAIVATEDPVPLTEGRYTVRVQGQPVAEGQCDAFGEFRVDLVETREVEIVLDHRGVPVRFDLPS